MVTRTKETISARYMPLIRVINYLLCLSRPVDAVWNATYCNKSILLQAYYYAATPNQENYYFVRLNEFHSRMIFLSQFLNSSSHVTTAIVKASELCKNFNRMNATKAAKYSKSIEINKLDWASMIYFTLNPALLFSQC